MSRQHPDAELLVVCAELAGLQAEWQRLWALTPSHNGRCPENNALDAYTDNVWPGIALSNDDPQWGPPAGPDVPRRLLGLHPTTPEGLRAKAAAILAMYDAAAFCDTRNDACAFTRSLLADVAGPGYRVPGDGLAG